MDATALVTFLFRTHRNVHHVELLGSWDNFQKAYTMKPDGRRGAGTWTGCFRFDDIVCDGEQLRWDKPRSGGLQQGGRYWYYYRLDLDSETFDEASPHSVPCPLLPGQTLNVLDVPTELISAPGRSRSFCADISQTMANMFLQTMDPMDKFARPVPPPRSRVHTRCVSACSRRRSIEASSPGANSPKSHLAAWFDSFRSRRPHSPERAVSPISPCSTLGEPLPLAIPRRTSSTSSRAVSRDGPSPLTVVPPWNLDEEVGSAVVPSEKSIATASSASEVHSVPLHGTNSAPSNASIWPAGDGQTSINSRRPILVPIHPLIAVSHAFSVDEHISAVSDIISPTASVGASSMDGCDTPDTFATDSCCGSLLDQPLQIDLEDREGKCDATHHSSLVCHSPFMSEYDDDVLTGSSDDLSPTNDSGYGEPEPTRGLFALPVAGASEATLRPLAVVDTTESHHGSEPCSDAKPSLALALDLDIRGESRDAGLWSTTSTGSLVDEVMSELACLHTSAGDTMRASEMTTLMHHVV